MEQHIILFLMFWVTAKWSTLGAKNVDRWNYGSACKIPVVISTCTWQILSGLFVDMWPWMRPDETILTQKWNGKVCSRNTQPNFNCSIFKQSRWPQGYDVCILGQRGSTDDWLLVAREDCHRWILRLISPQTAWSSQREARKVNTLGAASQRQCTV